MLCVLGIQTGISLLLKQSSDEGVIDSLASGQLLLVKVISLGLQTSASASLRVTGRSFEF